MTQEPQGLTYASSGVDDIAKEAAFERAARWLAKTYAFRPQVGRDLVGSGYFASVLDLGSGVHLAISVDSVGTKVIIGQRARRYESLGQDLVALNVNDLLCVGAEPIALVDYLAVASPDPDALEAIARGLYTGAEEARITIPAGETAQVGELLSGDPGRWHFDMVGTALGLVPSGRLLTGEAVQPGDIIVGLASSGLHTNGFSLVRRALLDRARLHLGSDIPELGGPLGDTLLEPTRCYVSFTSALWDAGIEVRALVNITGGGFLNLSRVRAPVGFEILDLPEPPAIFALVRRYGRVEPTEMYRTFNMGVGMCAVVPECDADRALAVAGQHRLDAWRLGHAVADVQRRVWLRPAGLVSEGGCFVADRGIVPEVG